MYRPLQPVTFQHQNLLTSLIRSCSYLCTGCGQRAHISNYCRKPNQLPDSQLRCMEIERDGPIPIYASLLSLPPGGKVFFLKRVRIVKGLPVILLENYVACDRCDAIHHQPATVANKEQPCPNKRS